jgi:hypothetical protein
MKIVFRYARPLLLLGFSLILLSTGCSFNRPYPVAWPALPESQATDCQSIKGIYDNPSETVDSQQYQPPLASLLLEDDSIKFYPTQVALSLPDPSTLEVTALGAYGEIFRQTLSTKDRQFVCENGHAVVTKHPRWVDADVAYVRQSFVVELIPSDEDLVAKVQESDVGVAMLVIPVVATSTTWSRFRRRVGFPTPSRNAKATDQVGHTAADYISGDSNLVGLHEARTYCPNADRGNADAQMFIGDTHYLGAYKLKRDPVRAWVWYSLAAQKGGELAMQQLSKVTTELSPEQLAEAKRQLEAWQPGQCIKGLVPDQKTQ